MAIRSASPEARQILEEIGVIDLPQDWDIIRVESLLSDDRGIAVGVMYPGDHDPAGIPLVKAGDLGGNRINPKPEFRITPDKHHEYRRTELAGGELLISLVGDVGRCALVTFRMAGWNVARAIAVLKFKSPVDGAFVRVCLMSSPLQHLMHAWSTTTVQATLNLKEIRQIPLPWPPTQERGAIAHILCTLDDKIELNRRMSETLEAMARALFKSWFVDFDPVRAKREGRWQRGQSLPGLPAHLYDLFPDRLVDSELGEIPEGWEVKSLSDCVDVVRGLSYKGSGLSDGGVPMHNLNSIYEGGGYKHDGLKRYDGDYRAQHVARAGDVIVANTEQGHQRLLIGYAAIVPACFGLETLFSHHIYRVRPNQESRLTADYLCHLLNTSVMHDIVSGYANGTTVNMLPIDGLQSPLIVVPSARAISAFTEIAESARLRHEEIVEESRALAAVRDTLLPKLISGEIRVHQAESRIDGALG